MRCKLTVGPPRSGKTAAKKNKSNAKRAGGNPNDDRNGKKARGKLVVVTTANADDADADPTTSAVSAGASAAAPALARSAATSGPHEQSTEPFVRHDGVDDGVDDPFEGVRPDSADGAGKWRRGLCGRHLTATGDKVGNGSAVAGAKPAPATDEAATGACACGSKRTLTVPGVKSAHKRAADGAAELQAVVRQQLQTAPVAFAELGRHLEAASGTVRVVELALESVPRRAGDAGLRPLKQRLTRRRVVCWGVVVEPEPRRLGRALAVAKLLRLEVANPVGRHLLASTLASSCSDWRGS